jgi:small subunit ribosomal protein S20
VANIKSQKKRILTNEKARLRNKSVKSSLKTAVRKFHEAAAAGSSDAKALAADANKAANRKSSISKQASSL